MIQRRDFLKKAGVFSTFLATPWLSGNKNREKSGLLFEKLPDNSSRSSTPHFNMCGYRAPKIDIVRIGFIGLGNRGSQAVPRINHIRNVSVSALCDIRQERVQITMDSIKGSGHKPTTYSGNEDSYKNMCERDDIDVIYIATPWDLHVPMAVYAMNHGKHVCLEVGPAESIDECWELVDASERNKKHCIFLENCNYDFFELLTLNMARQGYFGEIIHCEGAYIHNNVESLFDKNVRYDLWRLKENIGKNGNLYPTHGIGPIAQVLNINRGDKLNYMVSMSSDDFTMKNLEKRWEEKDSETFRKFSGEKFRGNMNTSIIKTNYGKTIMLQHDISSLRVYSRIHLISGTKGSAQKYPVPGKISKSHEDWLSKEDMMQVENIFNPPIIKKLGKMAIDVGGHGGMDFLMDWRWIDCLRNGLPIDNDVYDAALWMSISPLSIWSVAHGSSPVQIPDFTRGAWQNNKPVDLAINHTNLTETR